MRRLLPPRFVSANSLAARHIFPSAEPRQASRSAAGFTLIEVLVVLAIIAILAMLLLPALSAAKGKSQQVACLNHLKQLTLATHLYSADNEGKLPENLPNIPMRLGTNSWVNGNMKMSEESTNQLLIRQGKLFPYASQVSVYHCPADRSQTRGVLRARSYSMNGWMGSRYMETIYRPGTWQTFVRESELAAKTPAALWELIDEHEASIDDGWFLVTMDDSQPFVSFPASRHSHGYGLSFADAHVESYKLRDPASQFFESYVQISPKNSDWQRLKQVTTTR